jgi:histidyl-tRNA synthetase
VRLAATKRRKMIEISTVKGFQDWLPPESLKRDAVRNVIEKWFKLYGFLPIETPTVEFDELMAPNSEALEEKDEVISDRFRLRDKGGRELGLRYEFTFQLARILKQNPNLKLPFRRYQIGEVFRDEPVSFKRFRQFTQCDVDIIGDSSVNAEAECLALFSDILKELKIDFVIQVNNRKLLGSIIESVGIEKIKSVMKELDKVEKFGVDSIKTSLIKYAEPNQIITLFRMLEKDLEFFKKNAFVGAGEIEELIEVCKQYGLKINFNPCLIRGLGYYTGNIFEIKAAGQKDSVAGGGRYDKVVGRYLIKDVPAAGISFGLERLTELGKVQIEILPTVLVLSISQDAAATKLSKKLRAKGISCMVDFSKLTKALEYANAREIPFVVFVGQEEIGKKKFKLRNMKTGKEELLNEIQLIKKLS